MPECQIEVHRRGAGNALASPVIFAAKGGRLSLIVHHYYPMGTPNIGDRLVVRAIHRAVTRHFGPTEFVTFPVNDHYQRGDRPIGLRGENLDRSNAAADLVIIGGSNLLEPRKPRREGGLLSPLVGRWSVFTDVDSIQRLKPPVLLIGMGNGSSFGKPLRRYREPAISEIRLLHEKAFAHEVRDQKTVEMLATIGVKTICAGCPVTFLTPNPVQASPKDLPLAVSFPPIGIMSKPFGKAFMRQTMQYLAWLKDRGTPTVVTLHDSRDQQAAKEMVPRGLEIFFSEDLDELTACLQNTRGMIGFRLHGALHAMALGKPIIPVSLDWRGLAFLQTYGFDNISIRSMRLGQFPRLRTLTDRLLADDPELIRQLNEGKMKFLARYDQFLADAAKKFSRLRSSAAVSRAG